MDKSNHSEAKNNILTLEDIVNIVNKMQNDCSSKIVDYQLKDQSSEKLGITGYHLHLEIKVQRSTDADVETLHLFVKCIPLDNSKQAEFVKTHALYEKEIYFFDKIVPLIKCNFKIEKYLPECFLVKEGIIVLENLISQGYQMVPSFNDYKIMESALTALARLHSASLLAESFLNFESEFPMTLKERYPDAFEEKILSSIESKKSWFNTNVTLISNIMEHYGKDSGKVRKKCERVYDIIKPSKKHRNTICHADVHKYNLMFDETKPIPNCVIIDFQTMRYAPLVLDLLQLLHLHASRSFRIEHEAKLIKYYHSILEDTIKCNDLLGNVVIPTEEEILFGLKDLRIYGALMACCYNPVIMLKPNAVLEITNQGKNMEELIYKDRTKVTLAQMEEDESYKIMVLEVISELMDIN